MIKVTINLLFGWPAYLIFNVTGGRTKADNLLEPLTEGLNKNHFSSASQVMPSKLNYKPEMSSIGCGLVLFTLVYYNVFKWYVGPYLVVNSWLVLYTWLQHTDVNVPHYDDANFTQFKGALCTVDRPYP